MNNSLRFLVVALLLAVRATGAEPALTNIHYKTGDTLSDYERERCVLDLYLPTNRPFATFVWFHGGGLTGGSKPGGALPRTFVSEGIAFASVNYRLAPKVAFPAYIEDAAAAFAWVHEHIAEYGGSSNSVFVGGHSAGGYLTSMIGMNPVYLAKFGLDDNAIAGLIPVSGQMMTHFNVRTERGLEKNQITADDAAPIYYTRAKTAPQLIFMGDHDWPARLEENQYFVAMQRVAGNTNITFHLIADRTHGSIAGNITKDGDPVRTNMVNFIRDHSRM